MSTRGKGIVRGAAVVSFFSLLGKLLGFVQKQVMAFCFGTGSHADAYILVFQSVGSVLSGMARNAIAPFLPLFVEKKEREGEAAAWRFGWTVTLLFGGVLAAALLAGEWGAPYLVRVTSDFKDEATRALAVRLLRIILPGSLFLAVAGLAYLILNSYNRFAVPAMGDLLNRGVVIVVLLAVYRTLGIRALAWGMVLGGLACLLLQAAALGPKLRAFRPRADLRDPMLRKLGLLVPPVLVGAALAQARVILEGWFASGMGKGYVSSLSYARVLPDTFTLLVPYAVGVSIYPFFSDLAARGDRAGLTETLMGALRIIAFAAVPLTVGMVLLRVPIVQLAFQRGQFSAESVALTAAPLGYYTCGLTAFAMEIILMQFYFSMKDTRTPVVVGIIALGVHVMVIVGLKGALLHSSIALAAAVSKTLKVGVLYALLRRKGMDLQLRRSGGSLLKMLAAAGVMGAAIGLLYPLSGRLFGAPADASAMRAAILLVRLGAVAAAGVACYAAAAAALRIDELSQVRAWVKARVLRRGRREV